MNQGDDIALVDTRTLALQARIDLGLVPELMAEPEALVRPVSLVELHRATASRVLVGLSRLSTDFSLAAPGAFLSIDPAEQQPEFHALDPLLNCGRIIPVPGRPDRAAIACLGAPFASESERRSGAGVVLVELDAEGRVSVIGRWLSAEHPQLPPVGSATLALDEQRVLSVATGDITSGSTDQLVLLDLLSAEGQVVTSSDAAFVFGQGSVDPISSTVLIPDASRNELRRYTWSESEELIEESSVDLSQCHSLPPREVRFLGPAVYPD